MASTTIYPGSNATYDFYRDEARTIFAHRIHGLPEEVNKWHVTRKATGERFSKDLLVGRFDTIEEAAGVLGVTVGSDRLWAGERFDDFLVAAAPSAVSYFPPVRVAA